LSEDSEKVMANLNAELLKPTDIARRLGSRSWVYRYLQEQQPPPGQ